VSSQVDTRTRNIFINIIVSIVCIFVPFVGHIILTFMIANDYMTMGQKIIWLIVVWAIPVIGPFLYLLVGQRRHRLFG
jgi:hypothetical protein